MINDKYIIMAGKSKINIFNLSTKEELKKEIADYTTSYRYYQRLIAMRYISEGHSILETSDFIGVTQQTVHRWAKICESEGIKGLKPNFDGGPKGKLTKDQLIKLDKMIQERDNMNMKDLYLLIEEEFNVTYSMKQVGKIARNLGYNYSKAYPHFSKSPKDAPEQLKKT